MTWDSALDIPGEDVAVLQFRIDVSDTDAGTSDMISFPLDNYQDHALQLDEFDSEQSGIVRIDYTITDSSGDTIDVSFQYSLNNGTQWLKPTLLGNTLNITTYDNYISWNSVADASGIDHDAVWLRAIPDDGWAEGQSDTVIFHLDNNAPPVAHLDFPAGEQHDSVFVSFSWEDEEDDAVSWEIYYSDDGVNWNSPSYTVLHESVEDNLVEFVWLTKVDLPGIDVNDIHLKVEVSDTDPGEPTLQENIHIDNDQGRVTLAEISDEQSGNIPISYEISESGNDIMTLQALYKKPADSQWQTVTTSSQLTGIGSDKYSGSIIWQSGIDLANLDLPDVRIKVIPSDNWESGASDSIQIHVDNEIGPVVVSYFPGGDLQERVHWGESIAVIFDKPIQASSLTGNNISLSGTVSGNLAFTVFQDSATCVNIQPTGYYAALETLTVVLKSGITDVSGIAMDGNRNGDPDGSPEDDFSFSFRTTALGDYNLDGEINLVDFSQFKDAWLSDPQDYNYELGPVTGSLPNFILTPDNKYDLKDFMTLITMWNWSFDQIGDFLGSMSLAKPVRNEDSPVSLISNYERNGVWNAAMLDGLSLDICNRKDQAVGGVEIYLKYDPSILQFQETRLAAIPENDRDNWVVLSRNNSEKGIIAITLFPMFDTRYRICDFSRLGSVVFKSLLDCETEVFYQLTTISTEADSVIISKTTSTYSFETKPAVPRQFALHQNFPNPFNPATRIRYEIPKACDVKIAVFNMRGELVKWIIDKHQQPGYYEMNWDGHNNAGQQAASGLYLYRMQAGTYVKTRKMVLMK